MSSACAWLVIACVLATAYVQAQGRGGQAAPPQTAKAIAPIDLTGYWTAVVTEDWHVRMLTPSKVTSAAVWQGRSKTPASA